MANRIGNLVRSILSWLFATILVCGCIAGFYFFQRADEELRRHIEKELARTYPSHHVSVGSAHFVNGEGIRLHKVSIVQPATSEHRNRTELAFCDEIVLHCSPTMDQLLQGDVSIDRVTTRGLWLQPTRFHDGHWNLEQLIPECPSDRKMPTIVLHDARIELVDRLAAQPRVITFGNLHATIIPARFSEEKDGMITIDSNFASDYLRSAEISMKINPETFAWNMQGKVFDLHCDEELWRFLPPEIASQKLPIDGFQIRANMGFAAAKGPQEQIPRFMIKGSLFEGRFDAPRYLSNPVTEVAVPDFVVVRDEQQTGWSLNDISCKFGMTAIQATVESPTLSVSEGVQVSANAQSLQLTRELIGIMPPRVQQIWEKYKPLGIIDVNLQATNHAGKWRVVESNAACRDVSMLCSWFPYPVVGTKGNVHFRQDEKLVVDLFASVDHNSNGNPIHITADIDRPGKNFSGNIHVKSHDWLPLDSRMREALSPAVREILSDMGARGEIIFDAHLQRGVAANSSLEKQITIDVRNGGLLYRTFPYPLQNVRGRLQVEDNVWTFRDFVGQNDSCVVNAAGNWFAKGAIDSEGRDVGELRIGFTATDIPCDEELRTALPAGPQQIWQSLRPKGHIDHAKIDLVHRAGMATPELDIVVTQRKRKDDPLRRSLEIQPTWFPLEMNHVTGVVDYKRDGTFQIRNLNAEHGSEQRSITLQSSGGGIFRQDGTWEVNLRRIYADSVETTPEVTSALPRDLALAMRNLNFHGLLSIDGQMNFSGDSRPDSYVNSNWAAWVNLDNARFNVGGHDVTSAYGEVRVEGQRTAAGVVNSGFADLRSMICRGVHITGLKTPWSMNNDEFVFGTRASSINNNRSSPHLTANLFGGTVEADGVIGFASSYPFQIQFGLSNFNAAQVARDLAMPSQITGLGDARLQLSGSSAGTHTLLGHGNIRLRNANIARLPEIIALINTMRVRNTPADVFSSSDIDLRIEGPDVYLSRIDLHGESLSLKGRGWLSFDRRASLEFYSILGGEKGWLPLVRPLVGQASQQLLRIAANGTIDNLQWTRELLPGARAALNDLFPEQARQNTLSR